MLRKAYAAHNNIVVEGKKVEKSQICYGLGTNCGKPCNLLIVDRLPILSFLQSD